MRWLSIALAVSLVVYALGIAWSDNPTNAVRTVAFFLAPFASMLALLRDVRWHRKLVGQVLLAFALVAGIRLHRALSVRNTRAPPQQGLKGRERAPPLLPCELALPRSERARALSGIRGHRGRGLDGVADDRAARRAGDRDDRGTPGRAHRHLLADQLRRADRGSRPFGLVSVRHPRPGGRTRGRSDRLRRSRWWWEGPRRTRRWTRGATISPRSRADGRT